MFHNFLPFHILTNIKLYIIITIDKTRMLTLVDF
nr:MAG TPA: hypothetical protein [Caudoviricetes sp.]